MFGIYGLGPMVFVAVLWLLVVWAAYWLIRLGVRHGTLDALRQDRFEQERRRARSTEPRSPSQPN